MIFHKNYVILLHNQLFIINFLERVTMRTYSYNYSNLESSKIALNNLDRIDLKFDSPESKTESLQILEDLKKFIKTNHLKIRLDCRVRTRNRVKYVTSTRSYENLKKAVYLNEDTKDLNNTDTHTLSIYPREIR